MEAQNQPSSFDAAQVAAVQKKIALENKIKAGVNWFFWIAGLSLVNTMIYLFGYTLTFVVGLGVTQIVDGFLAGIASQLGETGILVRFAGFGIDALIAGIFVTFGILGRKHKKWAVITGMALYAVDAVILLFFRDIFGAGFHIFALVGLGTGLRAIHELKAMEIPAIDLRPLEGIARQAIQTPAATPQQTRIRILLVVGIALVFFVCMGILVVQSLLSVFSQ